MSAAQKIVRIFSLYAFTAVCLLLMTASPATVDPGSRSAQIVPRIPQKIGAWEGRDMETRQARAFFIVSDAAGFVPLVRTYTVQKSGGEIVLNALEDLTGHSRDIHDPHFCYESRGWTILNYEKLPINGGTYAGQMKWLTFVSGTDNSKRTEIFGYLVDQKIVTSDLALRLVHIRNRIKKLAGWPPSHVVYLGLSLETSNRNEQPHVGNLKSLMEEILRAL